MTEGPRIYNLFPLLAGPLPRLRLMMDLVINHTAFDAPPIQEHPTWFKRDDTGAIVHPGAKDGKTRVVWRVLAEVDNEASPDREALWGYWRDLTLHFADLGFLGFRCDAAYQVLSGLWREVIGAVKARHPDVLFFAETLGCTPQQTLATALAGLTRPLHVVETTPADWEAPRWDLTGAIAAVNRTKAAHRALNEEGPISPVALGGEPRFGFLKATGDGREAALVLLNPNRRGGFPADDLTPAGDPSSSGERAPWQGRKRL